MNTEKTFAYKLMLKSGDEIFFGPGVADLLEAIDKEGNVKDASNQMGLSYTKAWKMLKNASQATGRDVIKSEKGGNGGGKAFLTDEGRELLNRYRAFEEMCKSAIESSFRRAFDE